MKNKTDLQNEDIDILIGYLRSVDTRDIEALENISDDLGVQRLPQKKILLRFRLHLNGHYQPYL